MMEKKFTPLRLVHLAAMVVLAAMSVISIVRLYIGAASSPGAVWSIFLHIFQVFALMSGIIYFVYGAQKSAADYYKGFTIMMTLAYAFGAIAWIAVKASVLLIILRVAAVAVLAWLTFGQDLGKKKTWILFSALFFVEIVISILWLAGGFTAANVVSCLSRLILNGSLGLMIMAKYEDKDARGTV